MAKPTAVPTHTPPEGKPPAEATHDYHFTAVFPIHGKTDRERAKSLAALEVVLTELAKLVTDHGGTSTDDLVKRRKAKAAPEAPAAPPPNAAPDPAADLPDAD